MNKKVIRLTESDLHRIVKESVNRILNETNKKGPMQHWKRTDEAMSFKPEYEEELRQQVGDMAEQIREMIRQLTMYDRGMSNPLAELVENEPFIGKLSNVANDMERFANVNQPIYEHP